LSSPSPFVGEKPVQKKVGEICNISGVHLFSFLVLVRSGTPGIKGKHCQTKKKDKKKVTPGNLETDGCNRQL